MGDSSISDEICTGFAPAIIGECSLPVGERWTRQYGWTGVPPTWRAVGIDVNETAANLR